MPSVKYKTKTGSKSKEFPYTAMGQSQAKKFQKETSGKLTSNLRSDMKKKYGKKKA
jgi:hypothetical protein|tara:strand:+ start:1473 stop:1640 length:168 start_codon:yes stop_codon:yes gene_type:complete